MKNRKHIVDEQEIMRFNLRRENKKGVEMSRTELKVQLKEMGYSPSDQFIHAITEGINPPIIRLERGKYMFNKEPVHIDRLKKVWDDYTKICSKDKSSIVDELQIKAAISLLKKSGYRVLKQVTRYEEV